MKKSLIVASMVVAALAACGKQTPAPTPAPTPPADRHQVGNARAGSRAGDEEGRSQEVSSVTDGPVGLSYHRGPALPALRVSAVLFVQ